MSDLSLSSLIRKLSHKYYDQRISFEEYRSERGSLLSKIDEEYNGKPLDNGSNTEVSNDDKSLLMRTVSFFKGDDIEQS